MAPFARNGMGAGEHATADTHAAAHAGARDNAEDDLGAYRSPIRRLGQCKTIRIVSHAHGLPDGLCQVFVERMVDQVGRVRVLHEAGARADRSRDRDAHARVAGQPHPRRNNEIAHGADCVVITRLRRGRALAQDDCAVVAQRHDLDFGAAEVDADPHD